MKIPDDKIDEVRDATDIVGLISQYATLKKRGRSFMGLCPFHSEKTPSFSVDPVRGFYHCFGCGAGGSVFTFMMEMEKVSFPEAVRVLAEKAGIRLPVFKEDDKEVKETEVLYHANQFASDFFRECLYKTKAGEKVLDYLEKRGFERKTVDLFQMGYAPNRWDGLIQKASRSGVGIANLAKAGLVVQKKEGGGHYDRFRGRLMFPIHNPSGRVVGFGGRTLKEGKNIPKYLNSPETRIYRKSRLVYGLSQSASGVRREDRVLVVEGYTDVIQLFQNGVDYVVASSGTALTTEQAKLLARYTKHVVLVFDGDSAGFEAALRGVDVLVESGLHVDVVPLPGGQDPDGFIREKGSEAFYKVLREAQSIVDFRLGRLRASGKLESPSDRAEAAWALLNTISKVKDSLEQNLMMKDVAEKIGIEENALVRQMKKMRAGEKASADVSETKSISARRTSERGLLRLLVTDAETWNPILFQFTDPDDFHEEIRSVMAVYYEAYLKGRVPKSSALIDRFNDNPRTVQLLTELMAEGFEPDVDVRRFAFDCLLNIKEEDIQNRIQDVRESIRVRQAEGHDVSELEGEYFTLKQKKENIRSELDADWKKMVEI